TTRSVAAPGSAPPLATIGAASAAPSVRTSGPADEMKPKSASPSPSSVRGASPLFPLAGGVFRPLGTLVDRIVDLVRGRFLAAVLDRVDGLVHFLAGLLDRAFLLTGRDAERQERRQQSGPQQSRSAHRY